MSHKSKWITAVTVFVAAVSLIVVMQLAKTDGQLMLVIEDRHTEEVYLEEPLGVDGTFSVSYTHSVNKSEVEEYYCWQDQQIVLYKSRYNNFGAGVATELAQGEELYTDEQGFMVIDRMQVPIDTLAYRIGTISDHVLHIGEKSWHLKTLAPSLTSVVFKIHPK